MTSPKTSDYFILVLLSLIWASAFFNIKIATYSYGPITIAFLRIFFGMIPVLLLCFYKKIKIEVFSKDWKWFAAIGIINLVIPFFLIAYGVQKVQSNLAAILMSTTPISATILAHLFIDKEKINLVKILGIILGFLGIVYLFSENLLINDENLFSALMILVGSTFYVIGGILTLKISHKKNENVTASILIWGTIFVCPISLIIEQPWNLNPSLESTLSLIYLGVFPTGIAWLLRFMILKRNGLVFQSQVAYLIPIFGVILGYLFLNELVTSKILISLFIVILGIYFVKKSGDKKIEGI
ncbi:DMT family transporter [Candidatus Pelagibacter sp.]|jgi:drug/metabolite transporter (DMT)-like permease|nr:DMT family transporter [Candidatus Pelagibacter sp.]|tara:strand:+ start:1230 stop:2123 length:894 start_codon:yes stop_codon:yes gene_type:complete